MDGPLATALQGDVIDAVGMERVVDGLVELAGICCDAVAGGTSFAAQRQLLRRTHSLLNLAAWLDSGAPIPLRPGAPRIAGAHIAAAVEYVSAAWQRLSALAARLALADELLDFFQCVLSGDGTAIVAAAWRLKEVADAPPPESSDPAATLPPLPPVYRLADFRGRPWEAAQYVLLPATGLRAPDMAEIGEAVQPDSFVAPAAALLGVRAGIKEERFARATPHALATPQILHSAAADGPKLAALTSDDVAQLRARAPGVRVLPVVLYEVARRPELEVARTAPHAAPLAGLAVTVRVARAGGAQVPVAGARVLAFTDLAQRSGAEAVSDAAGMARLDLRPGTALEALVVYGPPGYWGLYRPRAVLASGELLELRPVDPAEPDYLRLLYGANGPDAGGGVTVGVIDTGIDSLHPDLRVAGGAALVVAENDGGGHGPAAVDGDHGTHVAGIIAGQVHASGRRGVAPGVRLLSYRVFPHAGTGATNYDIVRAIDRGVADGCDLLNLSLSGAVRDEAVRAALHDAWRQGTLCFAATGNDRRGPVSYPARWPEAVAVSAIGRIGTFPAGSSEALDVAEPRSSADAQLFVAGFANVGREVDLAGPGVGVVSTVAGGGYGAMSGTSMACPAIVGAAATLLARHPDVLALPRNAQRAEEMLRLLNGAARTLGFDREFEGLGLVP